MPCFILHRWSKWEPYLWEGWKWKQVWTGHVVTTSEKQEVSEERQKRRCLDCGLTQDRKV